MAEENQMKKFRENPDRFRSHLLDAFKECIAEIKNLMVGTAMESNGLPEHLEETLVNRINEMLAQTFKNYDVEASVKELNRLVENSSGEPVWMPKTREVDLSMEKERALLKRKELLQSTIKERDAQIEQLKCVITDKRNNLVQHFAELQKHIAGIDNFNEQR